MTRDGLDDSKAASRSAGDGWVRIGTASSLLASHRHHITLRTTTTTPIFYQSILLFSFQNPTVTSSHAKRTWYAMVSQCPHLGAPLESAPVRRADPGHGSSQVECSNEALPNGDPDGEAIDFEEDEDDIEDAVIVCPWHEYDFDLKTGESTTGLRACTFEVRVVSPDDAAGEEMVEVANPAREDDGRATEWEVTEVRPVSESFPGTGRSNSTQAAAESLHRAAEGLNISDKQGGKPEDALDATASSSVLPPDPLPKTLVAWACLILDTASPAHKVAYTRMAAEAFRTGECKVIGGGRWSAASKPDQSTVDCTEQQQDRKHSDRVWLRKPEETPPDTPPREAHVTTVRAGSEATRRGKGGSLRSRVTMLHSLANIELWAIDLGWDAIARAPELFARFREEHAETLTPQAGRSSLPLEFYNDFVKLSVDEAKHFSLLVERMAQLDGTKFGDLEVHQGLWDTAKMTRHSLFARLSIIHLVNEARGLDVNPSTILKMRKAGDEGSVKVLEIIHRDEVTHVAIGHRHLCYLCSLPSPPLRPVDVFRQEVKENFAGRLKGPFNAADRTKAGLTRDYYEDLVGEKKLRQEQGHYAATVGVGRTEIAGG
ncbi:unnamed protein product [Parajaminaea phylloscopi]